MSSQQNEKPQSRMEDKGVKRRERKGGEYNRRGAVPFFMDEGYAEINRAVSFESHTSD